MSTPNTSTGKTPSELLMKIVLRTRLSLVKPTVGGEIRDRQESQTETASRKCEMLPGESVAIWNPRQDIREPWLSGTVVQKLGPSNYFVNVNGQARCVHLEYICYIVISEVFHRTYIRSKFPILMIGLRF